MSRRVLLVEDEAPIRDMLSFVLEQSGFETIEAEDYDIAQQKLVEPYPDLILLDWMLPGGSGVQLAKSLKQHEFTRDIPVIMLTARGEEDDAENHGTTNTCEYASFLSSAHVRTKLWPSSSHTT